MMGCLFPIKCRGPSWCPCCATDRGRSSILSILTQRMQRLSKEGTRTMILNSFGGTATIMGKEHEVTYEAGALVIAGLTIGEAQSFVELLELVGSPAGVVITPKANHAVLRETTTAAPRHEQDAAEVVTDATGRVVKNRNGSVEETVEDAAPPPARVGRRAPTVDPATIAAVAEASPARVPKPEKDPAAPKTRRGGGKRTAIDDAVEPEDDDNAEAAPAPAPRAAAKPARDDDNEPEAEAAAVDDDIPFAEEEEEKPKAAAKPNGHANGHTNGKANGKPAGGFSEKIMSARKLKDILSYLIDEGVSDLPSLKVKCKELADAGHKILSTIPDLEDRVERTFGILDMGGEAG